MQPSFWIIAMALLQLATAFDFREVQTTLTVTTINTPSNYTFRFDRTTDNTYSQTNYTSQPVSTNATVTITFPTQYTNINATTCLSISVNNIAITSFSCSSSGNTVIFSNVFQSVGNLFVSAVVIVVGNVLNPVPAILTGGFTGTIGVDVAVSKGTGVQLTAGFFSSCSITFMPNYVYYSSSKMIISITPTNALAPGSTLRVQFPRSFWTNDISSQLLPISGSMACVNQSTNINSGISCIGSSNTLITVSNLFQNTVGSNFAFGVNNFLSPPSNQPSDAIVITSFSGTNRVDSCTVYPTGLIPNNFYSLTITPIATMTVNSLVGLRFNASLAVPINQNDYFEIVFPAGTTFTYSKIYGISFYSLPPTISGQTIQVRHDSSVTAIFAQNSAYILTLQNFRAPPSTLPTNPIVFSVLRNGYPIMSGSVSLIAVSGTLTASASMVNTKVSKNTSYVFSITMTNPLSSLGMIKIVLPSQVSISTNSSSCALLVGIGVNSVPFCTFSSSANSILISNLNSSTANIAAQNLQLTINGLTNPTDTSTSSSFTIITYFSNTEAGVTDTGVAAGVTATIGTIDISTVTIIPSSYVVYATGVTYTTSFNNTYTIPQNGYISITIPNDISISTVSLATYSKYALGTGAFISTSTVFTTTASLYRINFTNIAPTAAIAPSTIIRLQLDGICTNPSNTRIVSPFSITTFSPNGQIQTISGLTVQMTTPANFYTIDLIRDSQKNSEANSYTITLKQQASFPAGTLLFINFPNQLSMTLASTCFDLNGGNLTCTQTNYQSLTVTLPSVTGGAQYGVVVTRVRNSASYRPITSNFTFETKTNDQISSYNRQSKAISFTNSVPSGFSNLSYSFSPAAYADSNELTITVTPAGFVTPTYLLVALAPSLTPNTLSCYSFVGFVGTCTLASASTNTINVTGLSGTSQVSFTIRGFTSPMSAPSDFTTVTSFEAGYLVSQNTSFIKFSIRCVLPCKTCGVNLSSCQSCYNNSAISPFNLYFAPGSSCLASCPTGYFQTISLICSPCSSTCLTCSIVATNCTSCNLTSSYPALNLTGTTGACLVSCPYYYYLSNSSTPSQCRPCDNSTYHCSSCFSLTSCESCVAGFYLSGTTCTPNCPSLTTIANNGTWVCDPCSSQCATCLDSVDNCSSCSSTSAYFNGQCLSECPHPLVISAGTCGSCNPTCKVCSLVDTNCTACYTNSTLPYLTTTNTSIGSCTGTCPYSFYGDLTNGVCAPCSTLNIGCTNCSSQTTCFSCDNGYIFFKNTCLLTAPIGYFNDSGVATKCDSSCATCSLLASNCTSCVGNLSLSGNQCVSSCSNTSVAINNLCIACSAVSFCQTCSGSITFCTSCILRTPNVFLTSGSCQLTCPNYTYPDTATLTCKACTASSHCEMCTTAFSCNSCVTGYFLYNTSCVSNCPTHFIGLSRTCVACTNNCDTCVGSTSICSSCLPGYYLYNSTAPSCVNPCPTSLFMNNSTGTCTGCDPVCSTCGNYSNECLSCPSGAFLQGRNCLGNCSLGYYAVGSVCILCPSNCSACSSALSCSACAPSFYLYLNSCVSSCPPARPVVNINGICSTCTNTYCIACNSSNYCTGCYFPQVLVQGSCVSSCPKSYVLDSTGTICVYSPNSNSSAVNQTLTSSLRTASTFPVPFTVAAGFLGVACLMSKFQHQKTFIFGALYALWGILQWAAVAFLIAYYYLLGNDVWKLSYLLLLGGMASIYIFNLIFLLVQNISHRNDRRLKSWLTGTFNCCWYYCLSLVGLLTSNKIRNVLFCKLFAFSVFSARLESVHELKAYHAFGFFTILSSLAIIAGTIMLVFETKIGYDQLFMAEVDVLILCILQIVLALCHTRKSEDFFEDADEDGIYIHKRVEALDQILNDNVMPSYGQESQKSYLQRFQSARKFSVGDSLSEVGSVKSLRDVSIQAEQILGERSLISRLGTQQISELSLFHKNDVSLQHDEVKEMIDMSVGQNVFVKDVSIDPLSVSRHDVSVDANRPNQLDASVNQTPHILNEISVQYSKNNRSISMQYDKVSNHEVSIQHVPMYTDQTVHMTRQEQDLAIQCNPMQQSASIQYSAKPIIQHLQDDLPNETSSVVSKQQEPSDLDLQRRLLEGGIAPVQEGLRPQLEIDIEEKLQRKKLELENLQRDRWEREKEQARKDFQLKVQQQREQFEPIQPQQGRRDERLNNIFNNSEGQAPSSLMNTQEIIEIHLPPRPPRPPSARTEQEFINMLSGDKSNSNSHNLSKDSGFRAKIRVQSSNTMMGNDNALEIEQEGQQPYQHQLLQHTIDQFPSAEKSRSTANMTGRIGQRGPILEDSQVSFNLSQREDSINQHPLEPTHDRPNIPSKVEKTNLTQFLQKKRGFVESAHPRYSSRNQIVQQEDALARELQQRPLPAQRSEELFPSENSKFRKKSMKIESLEFDNNDHIHIPDNGSIQDALERQTKKGLGHKNSLKKIPSRDMLIERPVRGSSNSKGYLRQTFTSEEKRRSLEKIYLQKLKK